MSEVFFPTTIDEVCAMRAQYPEAAILAGGTDLFVRHRAGIIAPPVLIGLERIPSLRAIEMESGIIRIGSMTTFQDLLDSRIIRDHLPALFEAVKTLGSPPIRHMGTIGGNICTASPAGDTLPPLYILNAHTEIVSSGVTKTVPVHEFITGPGRTCMSDEDILTAILIPVPDQAMKGYYFKVGQRLSLAISIISMAAMVLLDLDQQVCSFRFAYGSVGPTVMRFADLEQHATGKIFSSELLSEMGNLAAGRIMPISDIRASARYRSQVAATLPLRILEGL